MKGTVQTFVWTLGLLAGLLQIVGYCLYYLKLFQKGIRPNIASWALWASGGFNGFFSYHSMTDDWAKSILPMLCNFSCVLIFLYALKGKNYQPLNAKQRWIAVCYGVAALVAVYSPTDGNLIQQIGTVLSFIPVLEGVQNDPSVEKPKPWFVWSSAYLVLLLVCIIRFKKWQELVYPINCFIWHFTVGLLASRRVRK